jgi:hypothetical protein
MPIKSQELSSDNKMRAVVAYKTYFNVLAGLTSTALKAITYPEHVRPNQSDKWRNDELPI